MPNFSASGAARTAFRRSAVAILMLLLTGCASASRDKVLQPMDVAAAAKPPSAQERQLLAAGEQALNTGNVQTAFAIYGRLLSSNPALSEALVGVAECQLRGDNPAEALALFKKADQGPKPQAKALQGEGLALLALGRDDDAEKLLRQAVAVDSNLWRAWSALGRVYDKRQDWPAAQAAYEKALHLDPPSGEAYNNVGVSLLMQKKYADARDAFLTALDRDPGLNEAQSNLRIAHAWNGEYDKALANSGAKDRAQILNNVGFIAMERGDYEEALQLLTEAVRSSPSFYKRAVDNLAQLRQRIGGERG